MSQDDSANLTSSVDIRHDASPCSSAMSRLTRVGILAGEASGDLLGAKLIDALRERFPGLEFEGIGGKAMMAKGCRSLFDIERLSVMGFIEPLKRLPDLLSLRRDVKNHFLKHKPDLFIGIDAPDFNLGLERELHHAGIPTIHYVSPSVWAWRQYRIKKIAKAVDMMLTLLPFEASFYQAHHIPVRYVGHPFAEQIPMNSDQAAARRELGIPERGEYVALLPGSRKQELNYLSEPFLLAAKQAYKERPHLTFLTSHVNEQRYHEFHAMHQRIAKEVPIVFFTHRAREVMAASNVVFVTSGTATLETMLYKKPMVIAYRMSRLTYALAKRLVKIPHVGLPNLLAGRMVVPELIQEKLTPEALCQHLFDYLDHPERVRELVKTFSDIHHGMMVDHTNEVVNAVVSVLDRRQLLTV